MMPILVVDFDGLLNPMPKGWFDIGAYRDSSVKETVKFLIAATEYFEIAIFGPRSLLFGGIQTMQAAIISWTTMEVNKATMHDLMAVLWFPTTEPVDYAVYINSTGVKRGSKYSELDVDALNFVSEWQVALATTARSPMIR